MVNKEGLRTLQYGTGAINSIRSGVETTQYLYSQWASLHEVTELPRFIQDSALFRPLQNLAASIFPYLSNLAL